MSHRPLISPNVYDTLTQHGAVRELARGYLLDVRRGKCSADWAATEIANAFTPVHASEKYYQQVRWEALKVLKSR